MRNFSNGGGVQSTAALVLSAERKIDFPVHIFANVGDDSESPATLEYVRNVAAPYATKHHIEFHEISRDWRGGETLYERTLREERSIGIPARNPTGRPGHRNCTKDFKISVIHKFLGKGKHVTGIGISLDEFHRMRTDSGYKNIVNEYPLIDMRLTRVDCAKIIKQAGLPLPPKSSCWFCPYHRTSEWRKLKRDNPNLFQKAIELESIIGQKNVALGKPTLYLSGKGMPLDHVLSIQPELIGPDEEESCESGYCMT